MSSMNIPPDDAALRARPSGDETRSVKPVAAYPVISPIQSHEEGHTAVRPLHPRPPRRRQGERRRRDEPVLLDTRTGGERRAGGARDDAQGDAPPHIDEYA